MDPNTPPANNPELGPSLLDGAEPAAFNMDAMVEAAAAQPKQQYDHVHVDPEADADVIDPEAGPVPTEAMTRKMRLATANFIMLQVDRAQAGIFTLFGAPGHSDDFRWNKDDRKEMAEYLEEGLPADFTLPWWVKLTIAAGTATGANVATLKAIKAEKRKAEEEAKAAKAREAQEADADRQTDLAREAYRARREERAERTAAATGGACEECGEPTQGANRFCSAKCRARNNGRKGGKPKG